MQKIVVRRWKTVMDEYDNLSCDDELHITTGVYTTVLEIAEEIKSLFSGIGKEIKITPAQSKDEVQKDARNVPDPLHKRILEIQNIC